MTLYPSNYYVERILNTGPISNHAKGQVLLRMPAFWCKDVVSLFVSVGAALLLDGSVLLATLKLR